VVHDSRYMSEPAVTEPAPQAAVEISRLRIWLWRIGIAAWLGVMGFALMALRREWAGFHIQDLNKALSHLGWRHVGLALLCTAAGYLSNAAIDLFSLRWLGKKIPRMQALGCSYVAAAFSMNAGGTLLGGGGIRMRLFTGMGLLPGEVAKMAGFAMVAGWTGNALVAGVLLLLAPGILPLINPILIRELAIILIGGVGAILWVNARRRGENVGESRFPPTGLLAGAILVSAIDWFMAGLAIRVLMPADLGAVGTAGFLGVIIVSQFLSALSHVPGGVGVLELSVTKLIGGALPAAWLAAALLSYRVIYYLIPFIIAAISMGIRELWGHRRHFSHGAGIIGNVWRRLGPRVGPLLALVGGFVLLLSANTPIEPIRREWLREWVPLMFVETSHFLSSIAGVALIIVARGLQRRVSAAWFAAVALSFLGMIFSLVKGVDYEESTILGFLLLCLLPYRSYFHRHAAMWSRRFTLEWWILLGGLTTIAVWLGFFTSRHVEYRNDLWWQFSFRGDASRFLRGQVGVAVLLIYIILMQWFRRTPPRALVKRKVTDEKTWEKITKLVNAAPQCQSHLALLGDKMFHFSESGRSFIMYGEQGRSRIVMGDPVGDEDEWDDLLWTFNEMAEDDGFRVCYYQISAGSIPHYVDMGMRLFKLGEDARVALTDFDVESSNARKLRKARNRAEREGLSFEIWSADRVKQDIVVLRTISNQWMTKHLAREKSFSLGRFDEVYIGRGPVAVVTQNGEPSAFANLWCGGESDELSVDLMRHVPEAPSCVMDYLFTELFLWGKSQGYRWFGLGMAPLSGMAAHPLAPLWQKLGSLIYQRGGAFYNFQGLREFKEKFNPEWEPRYLAVSSSWHLPAALTDITALIGGGWRNVIGRQKSTPS
jgi:phosphatidylglycerol lysyltransferase